MMKLELPYLLVSVKIGAGFCLQDCDLSGSNLEKLKKAAAGPKYIQVLFSRGF